MQSRGLAAVCLGAGLLSACADPDAPLDLPGNVDVDPGGEEEPGDPEVPCDPDAAGTPGTLAEEALRELAQRAYVKASNTDAGDVFGPGLALSADGSTLAVGAVGEDSAAAGVDGDGADDSAESAGAVYVFRRCGQTWRQQAYLKASHPDEGDAFGIAVALSADGSILAVGATGEDSAAAGVGGDPADDSVHDAGAVYVFRRHGQTWEQQAYLKASHPDPVDYFGGSVALSADGRTLAVGAWAEDSAATGVDGDAADNSASYAGAVTVFARDGASWRQEAYVKASNTGTGDYFGASVALSADGQTLAVGAWAEASASPGVGGDQADNSAGYAGAVYVFRRRGMTWHQEAYVKASNPDELDHFGGDVALSADGSILAVSAAREGSAATGVGGDQDDESAYVSGAVYVFTRRCVTWCQTAYVKASNTDPTDAFGSSVALSDDGTILAVGALGEASAATGVGGDQGDDSAPSAGAVYVLARHGTTWRHQDYVKPSNTGAVDFFGWSVALSGDGQALAASAPYEDSAATGVGGDQADDSASAAGAVYVFDRRRD